MARRMTSTRAQAMRRAQEAKQRRDVERLERERKVEAALADYFEQTQRAEAIRQQAAARAERVLADAQRAAAEPEHWAAVALRTLAALGESRSSIADLTGLSAAQIREALTADHTSGSRARDGSGDEPAPDFEDSATARGSERPSEVAGGREPQPELRTDAVDPPGDGSTG